MIALVAGCVLPELVLLGADLGLWGSARWRPMAYANGAFWAGLLHGWTPNYPAQPWLMFLTHGFLHAGPGHLAVNMVTLLSVAGILIERVGQLRFALLYALSMVGGGAGFALLTTKIQPMVGASGALFGLIGAWVVWNVADLHHRRAGPRAVAWALFWPVAALTLMNVAMYWAASGNLAWETHLGGGVAGMVLAPFLAGRRAGK